MTSTLTIIEECRFRCLTNGGEVPEWTCVAVCMDTLSTESYLAKVPATRKQAYRTREVEVFRASMPFVRGGPIKKG